MAWIRIFPSWMKVNGHQVWFSRMDSTSFCTTVAHPWWDIASEKVLGSKRKEIFGGVSKVVKR
jgi:hypothetical protein